MPFLRPALYNSCPALFRIDRADYSDSLVSERFLWACPAALPHGGHSRASVETPIGLDTTPARSETRSYLRHFDGGRSRQYSRPMPVEDDRFDAVGEQARARPTRPWHTAAVIPARFASTRFPGKSLAAETGKPLIQHVWERVCEASAINRVVVATDDRRIAEAVRSFGGEAMMTRPDHPSGTHRVGEVVRAMGAGANDIVLNVQGDEPEIDPSVLDRLIERMGATGTAGIAGTACPIATLACPFDDAGPREGPGSPVDPNCVKVVLDGRDRALYFSRSLIPYPRPDHGVVARPSRWLLHLGVYAFRAETLLEITDPSATPRESLAVVESLEQLRWLEEGRSMAVVVVEPQPPGIDTPEDYAAFVTRMGHATRR